MLLFALGVSITINIILFILIYITYKFIKYTRKKNKISEEIVDYDMMKSFFGSDKL